MTDISRIALFSSANGESKSIAVTAASQRVDLARINTNISGSMLVTVVGSDPVFVRLGDNTVTAALTDRPYLGNSQQVINLPAGVSYAAAISTGTGSTVYFTPGNGA
ncbi:MAG TPA: hypothetical protein VFM34_05180 [Moraxellaceae bacterium]|nr:hypothetical protein [Moraxellaceae bacterium]